MSDPLAYARKHVRFGWWSLLAFLTLGFVLEVLHGFKAPMYLNVSNETRRLMWTLSHAHGALISLINVVLGVCLRTIPELGANHLRRASQCLVGATIVLPGGFFLGGVTFYSGDPGVGIVLVPIGAALLGVAVYLIASSAEGMMTSQGPGRGTASKRRDRRESH